MAKNGNRGAVSPGQETIPSLPRRDKNPNAGLPSELGGAPADRQISQKTWDTAMTPQSQRDKRK